ncbi:MAG: TIGR03086 family metal-binding protein [Chloroflexota bacterium]
MSSIDNLQRALDGATAMMKNVTPDDSAKPTPCTEWDVKALANHMTGVCFMFATAAGGEAITSYGEPTDLVGNDPASTYAGAAAAAIASWGKEGALEQTVTLPLGALPGSVAIQINFIDQLLHTFDLAKAIGHAHSIEDHLAEAGLATLNMLMSPERRGPGKPFGEEVQVSADASIQDRMLAFSGRQP